MENGVRGRAQQDGTVLLIW